MKRNFFCLLLSLVFISVNGCIQNSKIDRFALVTRHNIENKTIDSLSSLSVGNGEFAFTVDITGLTYNSWFGKFHLEIHWWHAVHFALWQLTDILEKQMGYYFNIFENAKKTAEHQGYDGVRWPKNPDATTFFPDTMYVDYVRVYQNVTK